MRKIQIKKTKKKIEKAKQVSIIAKTRIQIKKIEAQSRQNKRVENTNLAIDKTQIDVDIFIKKENKKNE